MAEKDGIPRWWCQAVQGDPQTGQFGFCLKKKC